MLAFALGRPISGSGESWNARRDTKGGRPDLRVHRLRWPVAVSSGRHAGLAAGVDLPGALRWLQPGDRRLAAEDRSGALGRANEITVRRRPETARPGGDGRDLGVLLPLVRVHGARRAPLRLVGDAALGRADRRRAHSRRLLRL